MAAAETTAETPAAPRVKTLKGSFDKTVTALKDINAHSKKNLDAVVASVTAAAKGAETVGAATVAYSKKSFGDHVAAAKTLARAKTVQEALDLQADFAKSAFETYASEMKKMVELVSVSAKDTVSPLSARFATVVEHVRSARPI